MASKPTNKPRFAHDGAAPSGEVLEPSSGKKDIGWEGSEEPGHDYMNWIHATTYEWIAWLDSGTVEFGDAVVVAGDGASGGFQTLEPDIRHGNAVHPISPLSASVTAGTVDSTDANHGAGFTVTFPLHGLKVGDTIESVRLRLNDLGGAAWANPQLWHRDMTTRTATDITGTNSGGGAGDQWHTMTPASGGHVVLANKHYYVTAVSGAAGGSAYGGDVTVSRS